MLIPNIGVVSLKKDLFVNDTYFPGLSMKPPPGIAWQQIITYSCNAP